jgi:hypothetical protein
MMKAQISIEKVMLISAIVIVAIIVLFLIIKPVVKQESELNITRYIISEQIGNIYAGKNNLFLVLNKNISMPNNVKIYLKVSSPTLNESITVPYSLYYHFKTPDGKWIYYLNTSTFLLNLNSTQPINVYVVYVAAGNLSIVPKYITPASVIYYPPTAMETIPIYLLNMSALPQNAGKIYPGTKLYYAGSKVLISANSTSNYSFIGWYGYGNGNYTGPNSTAVITMNGNITEIARFGLLIPFNFKENFNVPYTVGYNTYISNNTVKLLDGLEYKYSFPSTYINTTTGIKYYLNSVTSTCGYNQNSGVINVSYNDYNCTFYANYTGYAPVLIYQKSYNNDGGSGTTSPASGYYQIGKPLTLIATPDQNSVLFEWVGSGYGSYTGNNTTHTIILKGPITETAIFGIKVPVYILSNMNGANITVGDNVYVANTITYLMLNGTYALSPETKMLNWGTRIQFTNYSGTTCRLNPNGTVTINNRGCIIQENYMKQYLLLIMEQLGDNPPQNTTQYGSLAPGNYTWEPVGANVIITGYSDVPGYSFVSFYGKYGNINYTGVDSYPLVNKPNSASATWSVTNYGIQPIYSCSQTTSGPTFLGWAKCNSIFYDVVSVEPAPRQEFSLKAAQVKMNSPIIEIAKYIQTTTYVKPGWYIINVSYIYENYTIESKITSYYGSYYGFYQRDEEDFVSKFYNGTLPVKICTNQSINNWTPGLGKQTVYYFSNGYYDFYSILAIQYYGGYVYSYTKSGSYGGVVNQTVQNLTNMPSYFHQVVGEIINNVKSNLSTKYKLSSSHPPSNNSVYYSGGIWFGATFKFANATIYYYYSPLTNVPSVSQTMWSYSQGYYQNGNVGNADYGPGFSLT